MKKAILSFLLVAGLFTAQAQDVSMVEYEKHTEYFVDGSLAASITILDKFEREEDVVIHYAQNRSLVTTVTQCVVAYQFGCLSNGSCYEDCVNSAGGIRSCHYLWWLKCFKKALADAAVEIE